MTRLHWSLLVLLTAFGPACGASEDFDKARDRAYCEYYVECGYFSDVDLCVAVTFPETDDPYLGAALDAGRIKYHASAGKACLKAIKKLECTYREDVDAALDRACDGVFEGTVPPEGDCLDSRECAGESSVCGFDPTCVAVDACCLGSCRILGAGGAKIGDDCTSRSCVDGATCMFDDGDASFTCVKIPGIGESCVGINECIEGAFCDSSVCKNLKGEGGACSYSGECTPPGFCRIEDGEAGGHCFHPAAEDKPCDVELDEDQACAKERQFCDAGRCHDRPGPGESCASYDDCIGYAYCDDTVCREFLAPGEPCTFKDRCYGDLYCDGDTCVRDGVSPDPDPVVCVIG